MRGDGRLYRRGKTWWIQYWFRGERHLESTGTTSKTEARDMLREKLAGLASGRTAPEDRKFTVADAFEAYLTNLGLKRGPLAVARVKTHVKPVADALGLDRASSITAERIDAYIRGRLAGTRLRGNGKLSTSKVNRETSLLRSALRFAQARGRISRVPAFTLLPEPPPRQGFWSSRDEFERFVGHLPDEDMRDVAWAGYLLGWRRSEVFGLRWEYVDMNATPHPEVRLPTTKNGKPRVIPLVDKLKDLFERRRERRTVPLADGSTYLADLVFHHRGKRFVDPRVAWDKALTDAGLPRRTWHDFRRTSARNMLNAGVPEKVAMEITGHRTRSIFDRYAIVAQADKAAALRKTMEHVAAEMPAEDNVRPLRQQPAAERVARGSVPRRTDTEPIQSTLGPVSADPT